MVGEVVPIETRLATVLAGSCAGVSVTALCAELGLSRQTYYRLRRRYEAEGPAGLAPRSRRPHTSPGATDPALELEIIRLRTDPGWPTPPRGAAAIADELRRTGLACPAVSTIHRVLVRNGLVAPQPQKRPRASYTRFVYPDPNGCWQIDATRWALADGAEAWIMDVLDDHSRVVVAAYACRRPPPPPRRPRCVPGARRGAAGPHPVRQRALFRGRGRRLSPVRSGHWIEGAAFPHIGEYVRRARYP
jgi:transposase